MQTGKKPEPKPEPHKDSGWQESRLPGERSGEGVQDLFDLLQRDQRRKAGLPPKQKDEKKPSDKR